METQSETKFCRHCGGKIPADAVLCTLCGRQVEEIRRESAAPQVIINNTNETNNVNQNMNNVVAAMHTRNKWAAFLLCFFLGYLGAHKFYEGKTGMGVLYLLTFGLLGIGWVIDCIALLFKPNPYYV